MKTVARFTCALLLGTAACWTPGADPSPVWEKSAPTACAPDLTLWPADDQLRDMALAAADRVNRASGLVVDVSDVAADAAVPIFWADSRGEWQGLAHVHDDGRPSWLMLDPATPVSVRPAVVLHEVLHGLGAKVHTDTGAGVLSTEIWERPEGWLITEADLALLCAVAPCTAFAPEATP